MSTWRVSAVLLLPLALAIACCAGTGTKTNTGRTFLELKTSDGHAIFVPVPRDEVLETSRSVGIDGIAIEAFTSGKLSISSQTTVQRVMKENPALNVFEVMNYFAAIRLASGAITKDEYSQQCKRMDDMIIEITKKKKTLSSN